MTWNCRTLAAWGRRRELVEVMRGGRYDVVALQETRWQGVLPSFHGYQVFGTLMENGAFGVALVVREGLEVTDVVQNSTMLAATVTGMSGREGAVLVITAHAPHGGNDDNTLLAWWDALNSFIAGARRKLDAANNAHPTPMLLMADVNARLQAPTAQQISTRTQTTLVQERNVASECLADLMAVNDLVACNALFTKPQSKLVTFEGTRGRRAQLDVICIDKRWQSAVIDATTIDQPVPSDHRPVVAHLKLRITASKKDTPAEKPAPRPDWAMLSDMKIAEPFAAKVLASCNGGDGTWTEFTDAVRLHTDTLPRVEPIERTKADVQCRLERVQVRKLRDLGSRHAALLASHNAEMTEEVRSFLKTFVELSVKKPKEAWKQIQQLVGRKGTEKEPGANSTDDEIVAHYRKVNGQERAAGAHVKFKLRTGEVLVEDGNFSWQEFSDALRALNNGKAVGVDGVPAELLKARPFQQSIFNFCRRYYDGEAHQLWLVTRLKLLPKKGDPTLVANTRGIALISVCLKLVNRMLLGRLRAFDHLLQPFQNGFRPGRGTVEQAMALQIIVDRALAAGQKLVMLYVDFSKAFDSVTFTAVRASLAAFRVPQAVIECIMRCYDGHEIIIPDKGTYDVKTGVLQGDTVAPYLFVVLLDCILHKSIDPRLGVRVDGRTPFFTGERDPERVTREAEAEKNGDPRKYEESFIAYLAFADDICFVAHSKAAAEKQLQSLQKLARSCGLEINVGKGKTEYQYFPGRADGVPAPPAEGHQIVSIDGKVVECVEAYRYLGTEPTDVEAAFSRRLGLTWAAARKLDQLWRTKTTSADDAKLKIKFFNAMVQSIFVYGCQTWPASREWTARIDGAYDRLLRWCFGQQYNRLALHKNGNIPLLSSLVTQRRANTVGHALRRDQALGRVLVRVPWRIGRGKGLERSIRAEVDWMFDCQQDERATWMLEAHDRDRWRSRARALAEHHENDEYNRLARQHQRRVAHPDRAKIVERRREWQREHNPFMLTLKPPTGDRSNAFAPPRPTAEAPSPRRLRSCIRPPPPRNGPDTADRAPSR